MTGLLGGGHAIYYDASTGKAENLDCFIAVPGLGRERRDVALLELDVPFGAEIVHYAVGIGSCGVPGLPAGLEALWKAHGRLPWPRLIEPALRLARDGVRMPAAHASCLAMLAPVMTMNEGARIYPLAANCSGKATSASPDSSTLEALADEGARSAYEGTIARSLLELMEERGGLVTEEDLTRYEVRWTDPVSVEFRGYDVRTRAGLSDFPSVLASLPHLRGLSEPERALAFVATLAEELPEQPGTTNLTVRDGDGSTCVLTTSLGLGSGDFLPGFDLHLNSMLGETRSADGAARARRADAEHDGALLRPRWTVALAGGAAGGTRLRSALLQVVAGPRRVPGATGGNRPPAHASRRPTRPPRARVQPGDDWLAGISRLRGPRVAQRPPLLRRSERRYAERRRG